MDIQKEVPTTFPVTRLCNIMVEGTLNQKSGDRVLVSAMVASQALPTLIVYFYGYVAFTPSTYFFMIFFALSHRVDACPKK